MASAEQEVRALLENWAEATRHKDIDRLMQLYAPEIVYFDVVPPLQFVGQDEVRRNFLRWFETHAKDISVEIRDLHVAVCGDLAVAFMLYRAGGTLTTGREVGYWVRASVSVRQFDGSWLIAHEHISLPVDFAAGRAVTDLVP